MMRAISNGKRRFIEEWLDNIIGQIVGVDIGL